MALAIVLTLAISATVNAAQLKTSVTTTPYSAEACDKSKNIGSLDDTVLFLLTPPGTILWTKDHPIKICIPPWTVARNTNVYETSYKFYLKVPRDSKPYLINKVILPDYNGRIISLNLDSVPVAGSTGTGILTISMLSTWRPDSADWQVSKSVNVLIPNEITAVNHGLNAKAKLQANAKIALNADLKYPVAYDVFPTNPTLFPALREKLNVGTSNVPPGTPKLVCNVNLKQTATVNLIATDQDPKIKQKLYMRAPLFSEYNREVNGRMRINNRDCKVYVLTPKGKFIEVGYLSEKSIGEIRGRQSLDWEQPISVTPQLIFVNNANGKRSFDRTSLDAIKFDSNCKVAVDTGTTNILANRGYLNSNQAKVTIASSRYFSTDKNWNLALYYLQPVTAKGTCDGNNITFQFLLNGKYGATSPDGTTGSE